MFPSPSLPAGFELSTRPSLPAGRGLFPRPSLPAGFDLSLRPTLPAGRDFGPVRTCGAFPPTAARRAPPVHEATGGYAVRSPCPSGIPRPRHNAPALGLQGLPCFGLLAASIRKSGLEIKNRCSTRLKNRCSTMESALCRGRGMPDGQGLRTA